MDNAASGLPNAASGLPNAASGLPNAASGMDNAASGMDNAASGMDNAASGMDNAASGMDNAASGLPNGAGGDMGRREKGEASITSGANGLPPPPCQPRRPERRLPRSYRSVYHRIMLHRHRFVALLLTAAPVIGLLGGCATDQKVIAQANDVNGTLQPAFITQADVAGYVQKVGDRIVDAARVAAKDGYKDHDLDKSSWMFKDIQFHLVNSETLNAFTTGGEHVYLYSQLFQDVDSEDAFAAVVAHEFGHIYGRHVQSGMNRQLLTLAAAAGAGATAYALAPENSKTQYATGAAGLPPPASGSSSAWASPAATRRRRTKWASTSTSSPATTRKSSPTFSRP